MLDKSKGTSYFGKIFHESSTKAGFIIGVFQAPLTSVYLSVKYIFPVMPSLMEKHFPKLNPDIRDGSSLILATALFIVCLCIGPIVGMVIEHELYKLSHKTPQLKH